jgi:hypothetical protein
MLEFTCIFGQCIFGQWEQKHSSVHSSMHSSCLLTAKLREQTKAWWLTPIDGAFRVSAAGTEAVPEFGAQLAKAREVLLAAEGSRDSLITPGLKIPLGGATIMDVLEAARIHHERGISTGVKVAWSATAADCAEAGCNAACGRLSPASCSTRSSQRS